MKILINILIIIFLLLQCRPSNSNDDLSGLLHLLVPISLNWKVYFSYPGRDKSIVKKEEAKNRLLDIIHNSKEELIIHIYGLTDPDVVTAIGEAKNRGVSIEIIADKDRSYKGLEDLSIPIRIWKGSGLHHPKILLSDRKKIFTGTGNFTLQGLLTDYDGYIETELSLSQANQFLNFIQEKSTFPYLTMGEVNFYNSPKEGPHIQKILLDSIRSAKWKIQYMIYTHYDGLISYELIQAAKRGVIVEGIYNRPTNPEGMYLSQFIQPFGSIIFEEENEDMIDDGVYGLGGLLHHKTMILDETVLLSGSYNYSQSARDQNREIFYQTENRYLVEEHLKEFIRVRSNSRQIFTKDESNSDWIYGWGEGIFHSLGVSNKIYSKEFRPISSGLFLKGRMNLTNDIWEQGSWATKDGVSLGKIVPSNSSIVEPDFWKHQYYRIQPILSLDLREAGQAILEFDREVDYMEAILFTRDGRFLAGRLNKINSKNYSWDLVLPSTSENSGIVFFRSKAGGVTNLGCYLVISKTLPSEYEYLLKENSIQALIQGEEVGTSCSKVLR